MRWLEPASWRTFLLQRELTMSRGITPHSKFYNRGRKAIFERLRGASHARTGTARLPTSPIIFTTKPRRACWLQPDTPRTSKSLRAAIIPAPRSKEHTSELQSRENLVCRLLLEKKKKKKK